jgi:hypothetical protein
MPATKPKTKKAKKKATQPTPSAPSPNAVGDNYRVRVRMYRRQGLGDCFLLTFPRKNRHPFNLLIDCGALQQKKGEMIKLAEHVEASVKPDPQTKARLDLVVATHEHKDHLSGFNQARDVFNRMDVGGVWLGWTENLSLDEVKAIKKAKKVAIERLQAAMGSKFADNAAMNGVSSLLEFSEADDTTGSGRIADALEYLKLRGKDAGNLEYLEPGDGPLNLEGVDGVRVYVLGPPRDPTLLKTSGVTKAMKDDEVIYHLGRTGVEGMDALSAALSSASNAPTAADERCHPFGAEHRIAHKSKWFRNIKQYIANTYDAPGEKWRRIDDDWLNAFGQLALDLDNDTNNSSLVLAFEFVKTREVLLFVGDAQVGNWQSWANVAFTVPGLQKPMPAHELLKRTVFYKVGHHASHNATIRNGGLELMESDKLVAFIPLDIGIAKKQGKKDANNRPKGWDMPAKPLYKRLLEKAGKRVVISDVNESVPPAALSAGVTFDPEKIHVDYILW